MTFTPTILTPSWSFQTTNQLPDVDYAGGFYDFGATADTFSPSITFGTADGPYAAHLMIVTGAVPGGSVTVRVSSNGTTGASINDNGVRTGVDSEDIVIPASTAANSYFETSKKWLGEVTIETVAGTPISCNYGWSKYFDLNNQDFCIIGLETLWVSDNTDTTSNIKLLHHKATGWTYNAGAPPDPPAPIASRFGDYDAIGDQNVSGEQGAWKRANLSVMINGADSEGILFEIDSANAAPGSLSFRTLTLQVSLYV